MTTAALVGVVLMLLTFGLMLVRAAAAIPSHQQLDSERRQAEEKGNALLRSWLTADQHEQWERERHFEVIGSDTGSRYRLTDSLSMNVLQLDGTGHTVAKWCFMPKGYLVKGDMLLAQKIALETMELEALEVANRYRL